MLRVLQVSQPHSEEGPFCRPLRCPGAEAGGRAAELQLSGDGCLALGVMVRPGAAWQPCGAPGASVMCQNYATSRTAACPLSLLPGGLPGRCVCRKEWEVALLKCGATRPRFEARLLLWTVLPLLAEPRFPCLESEEIPTSLEFRVWDLKGSQ